MDIIRVRKQLCGWEERRRREECRIQSRCDRILQIYLFHIPALNVQWDLFRIYLQVLTRFLSMKNSDLTADFPLLEYSAAGMRPLLELGYSIY